MTETTQVERPITIIKYLIRYVVMEEWKMKYTQEVKDKAVAAAKEGKSLKEIQQTIGPNPKAVQRYLVKAGIDYKKLREELRAAGKLQSSVNKQNAGKDKITPKIAAKPKTVEPSTTVIDE